AIAAEQFERRRHLVGGVQVTDDAKDVELSGDRLEKHLVAELRRNHRCGHSSGLSSSIKFTTGLTDHDGGGSGLKPSRRAARARTSGGRLVLSTVSSSRRSSSALSGALMCTQVQASSQTPTAPIALSARRLI